jgi:hypothetical protein
MAQQLPARRGRRGLLGTTPMAKRAHWYGPMARPAGTPHPPRTRLSGGRRSAPSLRSASPPGAPCPCQRPVKPAPVTPGSGYPLGWESLIGISLRMGTAAAPRRRSRAGPPCRTIRQCPSASSAPAGTEVSAIAESTTMGAAGARPRSLDESLDTATIVAIIRICCMRTTGY